MVATKEFKLIPTRDFCIFWCFLLAGSTYNDNDIDDEDNKVEVGKEAEGGIPEL